MRLSAEKVLRRKGEHNNEILEFSNGRGASGSSSSESSCLSLNVAISVDAAENRITTVRGMKSNLGEGRLGMFFPDWKGWFRAVLYGIDEKFRIVRWLVQGF